MTHAWTDSRSSKASLSSLLSSCSFCEASITRSARSRSRSRRRGLGKEGFTACAGTAEHQQDHASIGGMFNHHGVANSCPSSCWKGDALHGLYLSVILSALQGAPHPGIRLLRLLRADVGQAEAAVALLSVDQRWGAAMG